MATGPVTLAIGTRESQLLQSSIKNELSRRQWSDGDDDEVMAEYILVMLANNKSSSQIANELAELVGDGRDSDSIQDSVNKFVEWLWQEKDRMGRADVAAPSSSKVEQSHDNRSRRRSQSPVRRSREEPIDRSRRDQNGFRGQDGRWNDAAQERNMPRQRNARIRPSVDRPRRELFGSDQRENSSKMASDGMVLGRGDERSTSQIDMEDRHFQEIDTTPAQQGRSVKIAGTGNDRIFQRSLQQAQRDIKSPAANETLFARVSMPDPRAQEFVPKSNVSTKSILLTRLDPMLPNNQLPSTTDTNVDIDMNGHNTDYPTAPLDTALCRYSLKCTNPLCPFSHPSVASVAASKRTGDEPLVLKQEACRFQQLCTNADCSYSHVSPAVAFVLAKTNGKSPATSLDSGPGPCRFQMDCKNPSCTFLHYDSASGALTFPPAQKVKQNMSTNASKLDQALGEGAKPCRFGVACTRMDCHFSHPPERHIPEHTSNRMARFSGSEIEGEMETIIPAAS